MLWWVIWAALLTGVFGMYHFLGGVAAPSRASAPDSSIWLVGLAPVLIAMLIRWLVLPRVETAQAAFPLFVAGMAMAEATCILGIFAFPAQKEGLFILGALGMFQFIPLFARRYFA